MLKNRVMDEMTNTLDIRSFMKMYLDVRLLIKRTLTEDQRRLFAYQRDRLPMVEDEESFDSDLGVDNGIREPEAVKKFVTFLESYKIESELDRRLILGVLIRDFHNKKMQTGGEMVVQDYPIAESFKSNQFERVGLVQYGRDSPLE